jgi:hypothetical protein
VLRCLLVDDNRDFLDAAEHLLAGQELAARAPSTRVVLISAHEREDLHELIDETRALGFVPKRLLGAREIEALL